MNMLEEKITTVLSEHFRISRDLIDSDVTFAEIKFDSLTLVELALTLENELGIAIEDGELTDGMTVADAAGLLSARQAGL